MTSYELRPQNGRKSFYGKAIVECYENGTKKLYSYDTLVMSIDSDKQIHRHCATRAGRDAWDADDITTTTMSHIKSFLSEEFDEDFGDRFNAGKYRAMEVEDDIY